MAAQAKALQDVGQARSDIKGLQTERAAVANGSQSELSAGALATQKAVSDHFGNASDKTLSTVDRTLTGAQSILEDKGANFRFEKANIGNNFGQTVLGSSTIKLGTPFFQGGSATMRNQIVTEIHEATHINGTNFMTPERYESQALSPNLPSWYKTYNADNYGIFGYDIGH